MRARKAAREMLGFAALASAMTFSACAENSEEYKKARDEPTTKPAAAPLRAPCWIFSKMPGSSPPMTTTGKTGDVDRREGLRWNEDVD